MRLTTEGTELTGYSGLVASQRAKGVDEGFVIDHFPQLLGAAPRNRMLDRQ
jgi:hypothetical protein